jgi:amino acid transporter
VSGIIGSGWLFSAYIGAKAAGSGVYLSWTFTLFFFLLMTLAMSEVISMFPVRGLVGRIGAISHNRFFGAIFSFAIWLELVGSMPGEAQASVEYLASVSPGVSKALMDGGSLTFLGLVATFGFLVI